jgi:hypothetical protein
MMTAAGQEFAAYAAAGSPLKRLGKINDLGSFTFYMFSLCTHVMCVIIIMPYLFVAYNCGYYYALLYV